MKPVVVEGNTASSIAICPCRTRVYARFSNAVGVPKCSVRVTLFDERGKSDVISNARVVLDTE
jgi:hypothetical protein